MTTSQAEPVFWVSGKLTCTCRPTFTQSKGASMAIEGVQAAYSKALGLGSEQRASAAGWGSQASAKDNSNSLSNNPASGDPRGSSMFPCNFAGDPSTSVRKPRHDSHKGETALPPTGDSKGTFAS